MLAALMGAVPVINKKGGPHGASRTGLLLVQLRLATVLSSQQYIATQEWRRASLPRCPRHPHGGCGFARHSAYPRSPQGAWVARYRCPKDHVTFSLLPDCLPSRFGGAITELEQVVMLQESIGTTAAANQLRPPEDPAAVTLDSALRWVRRRTRLVHAALRGVIGLLPDLFAGIEPTVTAARAHLGALFVLGLLRQIAAAHLHALPPPLGFGPRPQRRWTRPARLHHSTGPDPP